jgi:FMN phosphatase YigB (HAD superfamily)
MIGDDYIVDIMGAEKSGMQGILFDQKNSYREGTHEWKNNKLSEIPGLIPWIKKTKL